MDRFYDLTAFSSNDPYLLLSETPSQESPTGEGHQLDSFGLGSEGLDASVPPLRRSQKVASVDHSPSHAPLRSDAQSPVSGAGAHKATTSRPPLRTSGLASPSTAGCGAGIVTSRLPPPSSAHHTNGKHSPNPATSPLFTASSAKPPPGRAPAPHAHTASLENANAQSIGGASQGITPSPFQRPLPPSEAASGAKASTRSGPNQVSLPRLSQVSVRTSASVGDNSVVVSRLSADHFVNGSTNVATPSPHGVSLTHTATPADGVSVSAAVPKRPFAVPPLHTSALTAHPTDLPVQEDLQASRSTSLVSPKDPSSIPTWLAQVNTHMSVQRLPSVSTAPPTELVSSNSNASGDADWLNPRTRPSTTTTTTAKPSLARFHPHPSSHGGSGTAASPQSVASPRGARHSSAPTSSEDQGSQRRLSSRRASGVETPHMGLAALHSDSGSSADPADTTDTHSFDRGLRSEVSSSTYAPSLHDGFVSIGHAQHHLTPTSQRGGGSQLWSGDSRASGASVANGHRQRPGGQLPASEVWGGSGNIHRSTKRMHPPSPQAAASMPSRPSAPTSSTDQSRYADSGPVRVPRENNYFRRLSREGSVIPGPAGAARGTGATGGRVQPLSLCPPREGATADDPGNENLTDVSSHASGVSLNAETTYIR